MQRIALHHSNTQHLTPLTLQSSLPPQVLELFRRVPDSDLQILDLGGRPENLLMTNLSVPPVCIRPSVEMEGGGGATRTTSRVRGCGMRWLGSVALGGEMYEVVSGIVGEMFGTGNTVGEMLGISKHRQHSHAGAQEVTAMHVQPHSPPPPSPAVKMMQIAMHLPSLTLSLSLAVKMMHSNASTF